MITLQHQSYVEDQGKAEVCGWRPTREIHKLAYQARHNLISRTRDSHQYHTLLLKAAQTPQMACRATRTKVFQAAAPKHALGVHRWQPAMLLLDTSRRNKHARDNQFMIQKSRSATRIDTLSAATRARHPPKSRSAVLHTSRHCARRGQ